MRTPKGKSSSFWACVLALVFLLAAFPAEASRVRPVNLVDMTERADRVFTGRCVDVRVMRDPVLDRVVTQLSFAVTRAAKGDLHGRVTVTMLGDLDARSEPSLGVSGLPRFRRGEEVVLFLYPDSRVGLTSPVGFGQGKFSIVQDKRGHRRAVNGFGNKHLLRGLSSEASKKIRVKDKPLEARPAVGVDELLDMVEALSRGPER